MRISIGEGFAAVWLLVDMDEEDEGGVGVEEVICV